MNDTEKSLRMKIVICGLFLAFLFTLIVWQFFRIQIIEGEKWAKKAEEQHYFYVRESCKRGAFWSNTSIKAGHPEQKLKLVIDIRKYHLYIDPKAIPKNNKGTVANKLLQFFLENIRDRRIYFEQFYKPSRSRRLVMWLTEDTKKAILAWWKPYAKKNRIASNAIFFIEDYQRSHPYGKLLGQVLHTVRVDKDQKTEKTFPTGGLEASLNRYLIGTAGKRRLLRSPRHALETQTIIKEPEAGCDVYLTINHVLQAICEEEIEKGVKKCEGKAGWAVLMDPKTGYILALAQYPFFYPDYYHQYFKDKVLQEHARVKAITDANEPGSVVKAITVAIALKANKELVSRGQQPIFHPLEKIDTSKGNFPGRARKPLRDTTFHHYLNMYMGIQKSSNIYPAILVYRIIQALGVEWYRAQLSEIFGFGIKTNIELLGESAGVIPKPGKLHPNGRPEWSASTPASTAMGHNLQTSTMQVARAYCVFANGGYLVQPTLVKKIIRCKKDGTEDVIIDNTSKERIQQFPKVLDSDIVREILCCLKFVTKIGGTSRRANIYGYTEAGKSGTAHKVVNGYYDHKSNFTNFVGFAPVQNPAFVLAIGIEDPKAGYIPGRGFNHHGGVSAALVFREMGRRVLEYLGISPDDPYGYPVGDPRFDGEKADWMKEVKALLALYEKWNGKK